MQVVQVTTWRLQYTTAPPWTLLPSLRAPRQQVQHVTIEEWECQQQQREQEGQHDTTHTTNRVDDAWRALEAALHAQPDSSAQQHMLHTVVQALQRRWPAVMPGRTPAPLQTRLAMVEVVLDTADRLFPGLDIAPPATATSHGTSNADDTQAAAPQAAGAPRPQPTGI